MKPATCSFCDSIITQIVHVHKKRHTQTRLGRGWLLVVLLRGKSELSVLLRWPTQQRREQDLFIKTLTVDLNVNELQLSTTCDCSCRFAVCHMYSPLPLPLPQCHPLSDHRSLLIVQVTSWIVFAFHP
eukprot:m.228841 g.228841  ORF g.228841 m.228841 type:complete len:128 (-) comp15196_c0_seq1:246-629(-)